MAKRRKKPKNTSLQGRFRKKKTLKPNNKGRNYLDPVYKKWRRDVKVRDGYLCQWPRCKSKTRLEVHHIKTWSENPALRFTVANGITLCNKCHKKIRGKEKEFEYFFLQLLQWQLLARLKSLKGD